jgi:bacteriorhodopsin
MTFLIVVVLLGLTFLLMSWVAIVDISRKSYDSPSLKLIWIGLVAFVPFFGCLAYLALGRKQGVRPLPAKQPNP